MKNAASRPFRFLQTTLIGGLFFLVPLIAVIVILGKVWIKLIGVGAKLSKIMGLKSMAGIEGGPIMTAVIFIIICLLAGLLIKLTLFTRMRDWIDAQLLKYIPGYEFYRISLEQKMTKEDVQNTRTPVLITMSGVSQLGVVVEELADGRKVVFVATKPNTREGSIYVVDDASIATLNTDEAGMNKLLLMQGKGLNEIMK